MHSGLPDPLVCMKYALVCMKYAHNASPNTVCITPPGICIAASPSGVMHMAAALCMSLRIQKSAANKLTIPV